MVLGPAKVFKSHFKKSWMVGRLFGSLVGGAFVDNMELGHIKDR